MRQNAERIAWVVLLSAFVLLCLIAVGVPLGIRQYVLFAQDDHQASVESLLGTVVVEPPVGRGPVPLGRGQSMMVPSGTVIRVDETSEAAVTFYDDDRVVSFMRVFSGTTVRIDRLSAPRFQWSALPRAIHLSLQGGRVHIGTALPIGLPVEFKVRTLQAETILDVDGSYALDANNDRSEISAYRGRAQVLAAEEQVTLVAPQRTLIAFNQPPAPPMGLARNLVVNGDFEEPLDVGWRVFNDQGTDGGDVDGEASVVDEERRAVRFFRSGGHGNHCETILEQVMDYQLPDPATSLVVRATVKVRYQSLSGGGYLSSEYPLMIRMTYRDVYDSEAEWVQGFYYQNTAGNPTTYGLQIPRDSWYIFDSGNLLEILPVRPYRIIKLRVYASGWDYESLISDISLIVE